MSRKGKNRDNNQITAGPAQLADQSGVASSNPTRLKRWLTSKVMTVLSNENKMLAKRDKAERLRKKNNYRHHVEYFHQLDDPYSHLAIQALQKLQSQYDIDISVHLVAGPTGDNLPEPTLLLDYAREDCSQIAPYYSCQFPTHANQPRAAQVAIAKQILARQILAEKDAVTVNNIAKVGVEVGRAVWSDKDLKPLAHQYGYSSEAETDQLIIKGSELQSRLGHYSGAMFFYGGEWYWGVDRLHYLEQRLTDLSANTAIEKPFVAPRRTIDIGPIKNNKGLTLAFYPSLRSPYTSIIFDRAVQMCHDSGVELVLRPVLPMVMRGVPVTQQKGMYIFFDAAREARSLGLNWGKIADPIGDPVRRAYSLFPWAREQGKESEFFSAFLQAAFFRGINTNRDKGMRTVVENAGLSWQQAQSIIGNHNWEAEFEANRMAMYQFQSWGVPSFQLLDKNGQCILGTWGQDRLWLVAEKIKQQLAAD